MYIGLNIPTVQNCVSTHK